MTGKISLSIVCIFFIKLCNGYFFRTYRVPRSVADAETSKSKSGTALPLRSKASRSNDKNPFVKNKIEMGVRVMDIFVMQEVIKQERSSQES